MDILHSFIVCQYWEGDVINNCFLHSIQPA